MLGDPRDELIFKDPSGLDAEAELLEDHLPKLPDEGVNTCHFHVKFFVV